MAAEEEKRYPAEPQQLPDFTYAPFMVALGVSLLCWGLIASIIISVVGLFTFGVGLWMWINEMRRESNKTDEPSNNLIENSTENDSTQHDKSSNRVIFRWIIAILETITFIRLIRNMIKNRRNKNNKPHHG